jgi:hypothetical protein
VPLEKPTTSKSALPAERAARPREADDAFADLAHHVVQVARAMRCSIAGAFAIRKTA